MKKRKNAFILSKYFLDYYFFQRALLKSKETSLFSFLLAKRAKPGTLADILKQRIFSRYERNSYQNFLKSSKELRMQCVMLIGNLNDKSSE